MSLPAGSVKKYGKHHWHVYCGEQYLWDAFAMIHDKAYTYLTTSMIVPPGTTKIELDDIYRFIEDNTVAVIPTSCDPVLHPTDSSQDQLLSFTSYVCSFQKSYSQEDTGWGGVTVLKL